MSSRKTYICEPNGYTCSCSAVSCTDPLRPYDRVYADRAGQGDCHKDVPVEQCQLSLGVSRGVDRSGLYSLGNWVRDRNEKDEADAGDDFDFGGS